MLNRLFCNHAYKDGKILAILGEDHYINLTDCYRVVREQICVFCGKKSREETNVYTNSRPEVG